MPSDAAWSVHPPLPPGPPPLEAVHEVITRWLGADYDLMVLDAVLAVAAAEQLDGDPAWLLVVSGSGAAKTETIAGLAGAGAHVTSTIASEGALLSGTASRERSKTATGGLLRKIGDRGLLVIKDVTSVLSMGGEARGQVLAALREVYDGRWERNLGVDGGRSLTWEGRIVVIGAVTTAWDKAHAVVSAMGDRFLLVRLDSTVGRISAGTRAIRNTGDEVPMRAEISRAIGDLLASVDTLSRLSLDQTETDTVLALADLVTLARTAVERDYRGDVIDAHAPEMPTRFAKQLTQVIRGGVAAGMDRGYALTLAARCARDSVPPLRLSILLDLADNPSSTTHAVRTRLDKPRATVDRELQALHMLSLVTVNEVTEPQGTRWYYSLRSDEHRTALTALQTGARFCSSVTHVHKEGLHEPSEQCTRRETAELGTSPTRLCPCPHGVDEGCQPHPFLDDQLVCSLCQREAS